METGLFGLVAVRKQPRDQMDNKVGRAAMPRVLDLREILELINNRLNDRSFAHQEFIRKVHQVVFHVVAQMRDEVESLLFEQGGQGSRDVPSVADQLAAKVFDHLGNRRAIIDVAWRQAAGEQLTALVDRQVRLESVQPAHRRFASPGIGGKDPVLRDAFGIAHFQRRRVNETDACTNAIAALQVGQHRDHHGGNQRYKAGITHQVQKFATQMYLHILRVIGFKRSIVRLVKVNQNGHHFAGPKLAGPLTLFAHRELTRFHLRQKAEHEIIDSTEYSDPRKT